MNNMLSMQSCAGCRLNHLPEVSPLVVWIKYIRDLYPVYPMHVICMCGKFDGRLWQMSRTCNLCDAGTITCSTSRSRDSCALLLRNNRPMALLLLYTFLLVGHPCCTFLMIQISKLKAYQLKALILTVRIIYGIRQAFQILSTYTPYCFDDHVCMACMI